MASIAGNGTSVGTNNKKTFLLKDLQGNKLNVDCGFYIYGNPGDVEYDEYGKYFYYYKETNRFLQIGLRANSSRANMYTLKPDPNNWENTPIPKIAFVVKDFKIDWDYYKKEVSRINKAERILKSDSIPETYRNELNDILKEDTELTPFEEEENALELLENNQCSMVGGKAIYVEFKKAFVIMPRMDGSLRKLVENQKLHYASIAPMIKEYARMLQCLWNDNLVYTDIKPANTAYRCVGNDRFEIQGIDIGDVFRIKDKEKQPDYVCTYPWYEGGESRSEFAGRKQKEIVDVYNIAFDKLQRDMQAAKAKADANGDNTGPGSDWRVEWQDKNNALDKTLKKKQRNLIDECTNYFHRIRNHPITTKNAEAHMVWGTVVMAALMVEDSWFDVFTHNRFVTNNEMKELIDKVCLKMTKAVMTSEKDYTPDVLFWTRVCKALRDPTSVTLKDLGEIKEPKPESGTPLLKLKKQDLTIKAAPIEDPSPPKSVFTDKQKEQKKNLLQQLVDYVVGRDKEKNKVQEESPNIGWIAEGVMKRRRKRQETRKKRRKKAVKNRPKARRRRGSKYGTARKAYQPQLKF